MISLPTAWRLERQGSFPARRKISSNSVGWLRSEIETWMLDRIHASNIAGEGEKR